VVLGLGEWGMRWARGQLLHFIDYDLFQFPVRSCHFAQPFRTGRELSQDGGFQQIYAEGVGIALLCPPSLTRSTRAEEEEMVRRGERKIAT